MLLLANSDIPGNGTDLEKALNAGWHKLSGQLSENPYQLEGYATDSIEMMQALFSGVSLDALATTKRPVFMETHAASTLIQNFSVMADSATYEGVPVSGHVIGSAVQLNYCRDTENRVWLVPSQESHPSGEMRVALTTSSINALALNIARKATADHGLKVTGVTVEPTASAAGDQLNLQVQIKAHKLIAGVTLNIAAQLNVINNNKLVLTDLKVSGEGTLGAMASQMAGKALQKWEGFEVPLGKFAFGGAHIKTVTVNADHGLEVKATFA